MEFFEKEKEAQKKLKKLAHEGWELKQGYPHAIAEPAFACGYPQRFIKARRAPGVQLVTFMGIVLQDGDQLVVGWYRWQCGAASAPYILRRGGRVIYAGWFYLKPFRPLSPVYWYEGKAYEYSPTGHSTGPFKDQEVKQGCWVWSAQHDAFCVQHPDYVSMMDD